MCLHHGTGFVDEQTEVDFRPDGVSRIGRIWCRTLEQCRQTIAIRLEVTRLDRRRRIARKCGPDEVKGDEVVLKKSTGQVIHT